MAFEQNFDLEIGEHRADTAQPSNSYHAEIDPESGYYIGAYAAFSTDCQW